MHRKLAVVSGQYVCRRVEIVRTLVDVHHASQVARETVFLAYP